MKNIDQARELAKSMVKIGKAYGRKMIIVLSNMSEPLGNMVGNSLEVMEAIDVLQEKEVNNQEALQKDYDAEEKSQAKDELEKINKQIEEKQYEPKDIGDINDFLGKYLDCIVSQPKFISSKSKKITITTGKIIERRWKAAAQLKDLRRTQL